MVETKSKKEDLSTSFKKLIVATEALPLDSAVGSKIRETITGSDFLKKLSGMKTFPEVQIKGLVETHQATLNERRWNSDVLILVLENHFDKIVSASSGSSGDNEGGADEGAEDESAPPADDGDEDEEEEEGSATGWIYSLRVISPVDKIIDNHRETKVVKTATNVQKTAIAGKTTLANGAKKAASFVRIVTGQTLLDKAVEEAVKRNPDSVPLKILACFVDIAYRIIMMALAAFFVISRPDKAIKKILGDDIVDNLPAS